MKRLAFCGESDDTFRVDIDGMTLQRDDYAEGTQAVFEVSSGANSLYVTGQYGVNGAPCWLIGIQMRREGVFPPWRVWFEPFSELSPELVLEVPDNIEVADVTDSVTSPGNVARQNNNEASSHAVNEVLLQPSLRQAPRESEHEVELDWDRVEESGLQAVVALLEAFTIDHPRASAHFGRFGLARQGKMGENPSCNQLWTRRDSLCSRSVMRMR